MGDSSTGVAAARWRRLFVSWENGGASQVPAVDMAYGALLRALGPDATGASLRFQGGRLQPTPNTTTMFEKHLPPPPDLLAPHMVQE